MARSRRGDNVIVPREHEHTRMAKACKQVTVRGASELLTVLLTCENIRPGLAPGAPEEYD